MTEEARKLADELDNALSVYLSNSKMGDASGRHFKGLAEVALKELLWDNKAGIIAALRSQPGTLAREEVQLQARKSHDERWIDIYPAQVEAMSQAGHQLRAVERTPSHEAGTQEPVACCRAQGPDSKCFCLPHRRKALWLASTITSHASGTSYKGENANNVRLVVQMLIDELSAAPASHGATREALVMAISHIEHMAHWIQKQQGGYSFEALGEDMPTMQAALLKETK